MRIGGITIAALIGAAPMGAVVAAGAGCSAGSGGRAGLDASVDGSVPIDLSTGLPTATDFVNGMWSDTVVGVPGNDLMTTQAAFVNTYRVYVRPRVAGRWRWAFWMSNATDSTHGPGPPRPNLLGGTWRIEGATVADGGPAPAGAVDAATLVPVTFAGQPDKTVQPGEAFWSDPIEIDLPDGHMLAFTWAVSAAGVGPVLPFTSAPFLTSYRAAGKNLAGQASSTGFAASYDPLVAPQLFATDRPVSQRLCFLGDSITQGIGSGRDTYGYWVAKIASGLGPDVGVWNLGSGWARAADAASDGFWLYKAKQCPEVAVILGVNDIINSQRTAEQILSDLTTTIDKLKQHDATRRIILFTVPTFSLSGQALATWRQVNETIRSQPPAGADRIFDIAAVLSLPAPDDALVRPEFKNGGDAHPNDAAGTAVAEAFLAWYRQ